MIFGKVTAQMDRSRTSGLLKLSLLIVLISIFQGGQSLHIRLHETEDSSNVYNKNLYLQELNNTQNRLKGDLEQIKTKFVKMNSQLNSTNVSSSSAVIKLQETLAEERDALFNIQRYLSIPFALKNCECLNFTEAQKKQLQNQINVIGKEIGELKKKMSVDQNGKPYQNPNCPAGNCPLGKQLKSQIDQLENYNRIMTETVQSQCCNKTVYIFRDNLAQNSDWIYGETTEKQYRSKLQERATKGKLAACPKSLPFVNETLNECFICPKDKPLYNLEKKSCVQGCDKSDLILNLTLHQCGYNETCKVGQKWSNITKRCQSDLGTSSRCPTNLPVWNEDTLSCQQCPKLHPFYDINIRFCRSCTQNEIWDQYTTTCYNKAYYHPVSCPNGSHYNVNTRKCQSENGTVLAPVQPPPKHTDNTPQTGSGTYAQCPFDAPYWDSVNFVCAKCPAETPLFNETSKKCEACPANTTWNYVSKTCVSAGHNCSLTQYWSDKTQKCENIVQCSVNQIFNKQTMQCQDQKQTGNVGVCPPDTPFWNDKTLNCQNCPLETPFWNLSSQKCQACPNNSAYDSATKTCKSNVTCAAGTVYNSKTNKCESTQCPQDHPIYNQNKGVCQSCPTGSVYNFQTKVCVSMAISISSVCPTERPYWNPARLGCQECGSGEQLNATTKKCEPVAAHFMLAARHNLSPGVQHS